MRILIIGFTKIKYMPYIKFYLKYINYLEHDVHILFWNRDCKDEKLEDDKYTYHEFKCYQEDDVKKVSKLKSFFKFRKFTKRVINEGGFNKIIVMHSLPAILIFDILKRKYKNKYIFDFRDITYEKKSFFRKLVHKICLLSDTTFCSSRGYLKVLPNTDKIYISHNLDYELLMYGKNLKEKEEHSEINICYWGFIRHEKLNKNLIDKIGTHDEFKLSYYGRIQDVGNRLINYANEKKYENIYFFGEYKPQDRVQFSKKCDFIDNLFDDFNMNSAMSNRFYDGLIFKIPQICMPNTEMGNLCIKYGVGVVASPYDDNFITIISEYLKKLNFEEFNKNCDYLLELFKKEYELGELKIKKFINNEVK